MYPNSADSLALLLTAPANGKRYSLEDPFVARELAGAGHIHSDVVTVMGEGIHRYFQEPVMKDGELVWKDGVTESLDTGILRPASDPFSPEGGLRLQVLRARHGLPRYRSHEALTDALACAELYLALIATLEARHAVTLGGLLRHRRL